MVAHTSWDAMSSLPEPTEVQLLTLRREAVAGGNTEVKQACDAALDGDVPALERMAKAWQVWFGKRCLWATRPAVKAKNPR